MAAEPDDSEGWVPFFYSASDGLRLGGRKYGWDEPSARLPVVCLPGLTRNASDFHELALHLSRGGKTRRRVLALDYRGRGLSDRDGDWQNYNLLTEAGDVLDGLVATGIGECAIVGTSRGALIAMILAALRPATLGAVIMNDSGPELDARALVRIRSYVGMEKDPSDWAEAVEAVRAIGASQFPRWDDAMWERQARRIFEEKQGRIVRRYDPELVKTLKAIDLDKPLPTLWPQFAGLKGVPAMLIRGANSDLLAPDTVEKMRQMHPRLEVVTVPDQGHAPDLGTDALPERIAAFVSATEGSRRRAA